MALHQKSTGILGTYVMWEDVESEMQKALGTDAVFGEKKTATNIGDMKGFMSRICLVEADWQGDEGQHLPHKFVVKISSQLAFVEMSEKMKEFGGDFMDEEKMVHMTPMVREFHNREVAMYKILTREANPHTPITKIYASREFDDDNQTKGYIISEYIEDLYSVNVYEVVSTKDIDQPLRAVAAMSAIGEHLVEEELVPFGKKDFAGQIMDVFFDEKSLAATRKMITSSVPASHAEQAGRVADLMNDFYGNPVFFHKLADIPQYLGFKAVLTHSDLWSSNMLWKKRADGSLEMKAVIDYQTVSVSNPAQDMCRLLVACLSGKERRENYKTILENFYGYFKKELNGAPVPYTFEQLEDCFDLYLPVSIIFVLPIVLPMLQMTGSVPVEQAEQIKEVATEKAVAMLEDFLEAHDRNVEKHPRFYSFEEGF